MLGQQAIDRTIQCAIAKMLAALDAGDKQATRAVILDEMNGIKRWIASNTTGHRPAEEGAGRGRRQSG